MGATDRQRWFRGIFRALRSVGTEDALERHLAEENLRMEGIWAAGPLDAALVRRLYAQQDPLSLVLRGRLHLEETLDAVIVKKFKHPEILLQGRLSFSAKMDLLRAAGFLDDKLYRDLVHASRLRNSYAHHLSSDIGEYDLSTFSDCAGLKAVTQKFGSPEARECINLFVFRQILLHLLLRLTVRHKLGPAAPLMQAGEHDGGGE